MKLHSPQFQKQLRRGVKKAIRESRELKKEYRRAKKFRTRTNLGWLVRGLFSFAFGFGVFAITAATGHPTTGLALIALWTFAWIFFHAKNLWMALHDHFDIPALRLLPVPEEVIFRWELQKFFRKAFMSLLDLAAGFGALGLFLKFTPGQWLAVPPIALLSWLTLMALTALCVIHVPRRTCQIITASFFIFGFVLLFANKITGKASLNFLDRTAPDLNLLLPTGWPVSLFQLLLPEGRWSVLLLVIPITLILWSLKYSLQRLQNDFRFEEQIVPVAPDLVPGVDAEDLVEASPTVQSSQHLGLTAIEEIVQSRQFLVPVPWHQSGWFEQRLWNWLGSREKALSEFLFPKGYAITTPWLKILRNLVIAVVAALAVGLVSPTGKFWILGIGLFITVCQALALILGTGVAFRSMFCSGVNIPVYVGFGIGYRELSRLLIKCSVVQTPLFIPFIMICGMLVTGLSGLPWQVGIVISFKVSILLFATRFIFIMFAFSSGTNDSSKFRVRTLMLFVVIISLGLAFLGLGAAGLFVPNAPMAWILWVLAVLDAYALFGVYGWFYHANRFDLMAVPQR